MRAMFAVLLATAAMSPAAPVMTVLDNGLTVITEEMDYTRSVAVVVLYKVGARNETADLAGVSHFTEHMLFNGTPDMPHTRFWQIVQKNGGSANAGTGQDNTIYHLHFPASRLEDALAIESDRMRNCPMDSATVAAEIGVVLDEWRLGEDSPDGAIWRRATELMHPVHPYGRPVIGYQETISGFTRQTVKAYYDTWYQPGNAALVIVGDIDNDAALSMAKSYFENIPGVPVPGLDLPHDPPLNGPLREAFSFPSESERIQLCFQACEQLHPDMAPLSFIASYLSSGRTSWLENNIVLTGLASAAGATAPWSIDASSFRIHASVQEGVSPDSVEGLILQELHRLSTELLDQETMDGIKRRFLASEIISADNPLDVAWRRAYYWHLSGDPMYRDRFLDRISALTPEAVRDAASRYFVPERMLSVRMSPGGGAPSASGDPDPHRELAPPEDLSWEGLVISREDLAVPEASVSEGVRRFTLENGIRLLVREDSTFPIVEIVFTFPMGNRRTTPDRAGLAQLTAETMLGGTLELDRRAFHGRLEEIGAGTWLRTNSSYSTGNTFGLSSDADILFMSTADLLTRPALREDDFLAARARMAGRLLMSREQPMGRVFSEAETVLEGEASAFVTTQETLDGISVQSVRDFYGQCARPSETVIAVVGDITPERALEAARLHFGGWTEPEGETPPLREYSFRDVPGDTIAVSIPGRIQSATAVMCPAPGLSSPDEPAFSVAARLLGAGISSRLGRYIREQQGLAYAVWGFSDAASSGLVHSARFTAMYSTANSMNLRALQSTVNECRRLALEGVPETELLVEQSRSAGSHALSYDTYGDLAGYLAMVETMGLGLDRDVERLRLITALTPDDVQRAAARYLTGAWFVYSAGGIGEDLMPLEP